MDKSQFSDTPREENSRQRQSLAMGRQSLIDASGLGAILSTCANPGCKSRWMLLWRSRSRPFFEGGWNCSPACTAKRMEAAVRREVDGRTGDPPVRQHRVPLGLVMLEQGWISSEQLRQALKAQKEAGEGRLGAWLMRQAGVDEQMVARALSLQWSCPVLSLDLFDADRMTPALPRLFVDAFGALPIRVAANLILYMGFDQRLDPVLALAVERMLQLRVETGVVRSSHFRYAQEQMLEASFPRTDLIEAASEAPMVRVLTNAVEKTRPVEARLVRVHDLLWMRMWHRPQVGALPESSDVEDVICSLNPD